MANNLQDLGEREDTWEKVSALAGTKLLNLKAHFLSDGIGEEMQTEGRGAGVSSETEVAAAADNTHHAGPPGEPKQISLSYFWITPSTVKRSLWSYLRYSPRLPLALWWKVLLNWSRDPTSHLGRGQTRGDATENKCSQGETKHSFLCFSNYPGWRIRLSACNFQSTVDQCLGKLFITKMNDQ